MQRGTALLSLGIVLLASALARAEDASPQQLQAARGLADAGLELHNAGNYKECYERFKAAEAIVHAPPHVQYMARCKAGMGDLVDAHNLYRQLAEEELSGSASDAFRDAQEAARKELAELSPRIPRVTVTVTGPPAGAATVLIDGQAIANPSEPTPIDPGSHRVQITAEGFATLEETIEVAEASTPALSFELEPAEEGTGGPVGGGGGDKTGGDSPSLVPPIIVMGVGVAGIAVGIATGVIALGKSDDLAAACPQRNQCPRENEALEEDAQTFGTVSTVAFIAGGAALAGGTLWLVLNLVSDDSAEAASWAPWSDGTQLGVVGRF